MISTFPASAEPIADARPADQLLRDPARDVVDDEEEVDRFTRWLSQPDGSRLGRSQFQISGMFCVACARTIEAALKACPGVVDARVNGSSARAEIDWLAEQTRPSALVAAVREIGYDAAPDLATPARLLRQRAARQGWWRLFVAAFCMMQVMMYATPIYIAAPGEMPADQLRLLQWAGWLLTLPVLLFSAGPLYRGAWQSLRQRRITMDIPVVLGISIAFVVSSGATFDPGGIFGHEVWFDSVTMFVFLLLGARSLELTARHRAAATLESAMATLPDRVERLLDNGSSEMVGVRRLRAGDRVRVAVGQAFPADGQLIQGRTLADESLLSGESTAVLKGERDAVIAGSINLRSSVVMRVERIGDDTRYAAIVALMQQAANERPPSVRSVDRLAAPFLWVVLLLAAAAAIAWSFIDPARVVVVAVAVLIVTCPCALSLATPSALLAGGSALARLGLLPRSLGFIETLADVDTVIFDKTGTLTDDSLSVRRTTRLEAPAEYDVATLIGLAAGLARGSTHPAAKAVAGTAKVTDAASSAWREIEEIAGDGLQARDSTGRLFRLGRRAWVAASATDHTTNVDIDGLGAADVCFGPVGQPWLGFDLSESLRPDALTAVRQLRAQGLQLMIASGDHPSKVD
ncbi:MAG: HAD-IC family P-type ATPase, partial [Ideonella sp.]